MRLVITWLDDEHDLYDVEEVFNSRDEALHFLEKCDMNQYEGHEIVKWRLYD